MGNIIGPPTPDKNNTSNDIAETNRLLPVEGQEKEEITLSSTKSINIPKKSYYEHSRSTYEDTGLPLSSSSLVPMVIGSPTDSMKLSPFPNLSSIQHHSNTVLMSTSQEPNMSASVGLENAQIPTVFSWRHGGKEVYLTGTFNNWKEKLPMQQSQGDFSCIQYLKAGSYHYRFVVDGKWQTDPSQPITATVNGEVNNLLEVKTQQKEDTLFGQPVAIVSGSPPGTGEYSQIEPTDILLDIDQKSGTNNGPPSLPPHLLRALLNTAPPSARDPTLLPLPHHVMLNHFYSLPQKEDKVVILGITQRYKEKFVTTVFYKPL